MTHDLLRTLIETLGGKVESVVISELKNDTFYARINLMVDGNRIEVDSRPSDALALAVRVGTPILVEESVLGKAGLGLDDEENWKPAPLTEGKGTESGQVRPRLNKQVSKEDMDRMSAYSNFLNTLNLDDLGKRRS